MRRPTWTETLLLVLLGAIAAGMFSRDQGLIFNQAQAGNAAATRSGVIAFPDKDSRGQLLYLVETGRQRICVYRWMNPGLRLVSARAYDYDMEVLDSTGDKTIEGVGATRGYVKATVESERRARQLKSLKK